MVCAVTMSMLDLVFPQFSKIFINDFIPNQKISQIWLFTGILFGLYILRLICAYVMGYWGHIMGTRMETDMRSDLFRHLQTLPFKYFDDNKTGQIMSRFMGDLREIGEMAHHGPEDLFISILMITGSMTLLILINPILTLCMLVVVVLLVIFVLTRRTATILSFRIIKKRHAEINARIENSISGIRLCKSFANEEFEVEKFEGSNQEYKESWNGAYHQLAVLSSVTNFLTDLIGLVAIGGGGILMYHNMISTGDLVAFLLYSAMFVVPIRRLNQFTQQLMEGVAGFERFEEMMKIQTNIADPPNACELKDPQGQIEFNNVSFKYNEKDPWILSKFNLKIDSGQSLALVGPSGIGKTTLVNLIPHFYNVNGGEILIDGVNVNQISLHSLHQNIGIVQQDVIIFWGTIKENIAYGRPNATDEEIVDAAKKAEIHDFIVGLPNGYDSLVGERGVKLSGGQKQRISIARIFLKNPSILILDEPTSSMDNVTEQYIQNSIEKLAKGRTTIIVAHRLSTIKNADEILVLTDQGIAERGSHEQLMIQQGIYYTLFQAQYKGQVKRF